MSVTKQTYSNIEIVIIDDGSCDNSYQKILEHPDSRVTLIQHNYQRGAQAARNTGIRAANGKWIAFLDSDDEWYPDKLSKQVSILDSMNWNENVVVHCDMEKYSPDTQLKNYWKLPLVSGKHCYTTLLRSPGPLFPTLLVSKRALFAIGLLDENIPSYQEWDTALRLARTCEFIHLREPLAVYWLHAGETISKDQRRDITGYRYVIEKHRNEIERVLGIDGWYQAQASLANRCTTLGFLTEANKILRQLPFWNYWRMKANIRLYLKKCLNWERRLLC